MLSSSSLCGRRTFLGAAVRCRARTLCSPSANSRFKETIFELRKFARNLMLSVGAATTVAVGGLALYMSIRPGAVQVIDDVLQVIQLSGVLPTAIAASSLEKTVPVLLEKDFVKRPELEHQISCAETGSPNGRYTIVYGPKGVGKSALVRYVAGSRKGVVSVHVTSNHDKGSLTKELVKVLLGSKVDGSDIDADSVVTAISRCATTPVTIVFDVERGSSDSSDECLRAVRSLVKVLASCSRCVIVLSEANTVVDFGRDPREDFVLVGELNKAEALDLLHKKKSKLSQEEMQAVFDKVGTSPTVLEELHCKLRDGATYEAFFTTKIAMAKADLVEFPLKPILKALKDTPDGVSLDVFGNTTYLGVDLSSPSQVGKEMKKYRNPIVFDMEQGKYILMSRAHRTALADYEPVIAQSAVGGKQNPVPTGGWTWGEWWPRTTA